MARRRLSKQVWQYRHWYGLLWCPLTILLWNRVAVAQTRESDAVELGNIWLLVAGALVFS